MRLGGSTTYYLVAIFMQYKNAKNYENWLLVEKVIATIQDDVFFLRHSVDSRLNPAVFDIGPTVYTHYTVNTIDHLGENGGKLKKGHWIAAKI